jgi:hypothetical protein
MSDVDKLTKEIAKKLKSGDPKAKKKFYKLSCQDLITVLDAIVKVWNTQVDKDSDGPVVIFQDPQYRECITYMVLRLHADVDVWAGQIFWLSTWHSLFTRRSIISDTTVRGAIHIGDGRQGLGPGRGRPELVAERLALGGLSIDQLREWRVANGFPAEIDLPNPNKKGSSKIEPTGAVSDSQLGHLANAMLGLTDMVEDQSAKIEALMESNARLEQMILQMSHGASTEPTAVGPVPVAPEAPRRLPGRPTPVARPPKAVRKGPTIDIIRSRRIAARRDDFGIGDSAELN